MKRITNLANGTNSTNVLDGSVVLGKTAVFTTSFPYFTRIKNEKYPRQLFAIGDIGWKILIIEDDGDVKINFPSPRQK